MVAEAIPQPQRGLSGQETGDLSRLPVGRRAVVRGLDAVGLARRRLLDLGLVPGTVVEAVMASPAGDPVAYRVRGAMLALRAADARAVRVEGFFGER